MISRKLASVVTPSTSVGTNIGPDAVHLLVIKEVPIFLFFLSFTTMYLIQGHPILFFITWHTCWPDMLTLSNKKCGSNLNFCSHYFLFMYGMQSSMFPTYFTCQLFRGNQDQMAVQLVMDLPLLIVPHCESGLVLFLMMLPVLLWELCWCR